MSAPVRPTLCSHHMRVGTSPQIMQRRAQEPDARYEEDGSPPNDQEDRGDRGLSQRVLDERAAPDALCDPRDWKRYWQRFLRLTGHVSTSIATGAASRVIQNPIWGILALVSTAPARHGLADWKPAKSKRGCLLRSNRVLRSRTYACSDRWATGAEC